MHGFLIIDKPGGITSHDIVRRIRRKLRLKRVGHGGTLDPMATGLVPVAVGDATRLLEYFSDSDKGYLATMRLGETTDSQDADGKIIQTGSWEGLRESEVEAAIRTMSGPIEQVPPMHSALKRNGTPLYKLARQGVDVERKARSIVIRSIRMTSCRLPEVSFDVVCSKGTYVRTLAHDVGLKLGCGAHLIALRRYVHGPYSLDQAITLDAFEALSDQDAQKALIPLINVLPEFPLVRLNQDAVDRLMNGVPPQEPEVELTDGLQEGQAVRLTDGEKLLGIAIYSPSRVNEKRGDFELSKVFTLGQ